MAIACAATLRPAGIHIERAEDAARALEPLAGAQASLVFGVGLVGAALLAAAIVPLATAYSVAEALGRPSDLDDAVGQDRLFYATFISLVTVAAIVVCIPDLSLISLIYASQIINAIFLPPQLVLLLRLNRDPAVVGDRGISRAVVAVSWIGIVVVCASLVALCAALLVR